jgi:hypothetical protein
MMLRLSAILYEVPGAFLCELDPAGLLIFRVAHPALKQNFGGLV